MPINVVVPDLGPSIEEAVLVKWLVSEGAFVRRGTPLFSVETDKTVVDCECAADGYLTGIVASEGATVRVHEILAVLADIDESIRPTVEVSRTPSVDDARGPESSEPVHVVDPIAPERVGAAEAPDVRATTGMQAGGATEAARPRVSPRARRMARETGVVAEMLRGSGPMGRVVQRDVEAFIADALASATRAPLGAPVQVLGSGAKRDVPLSAMRRTIARRLTESAQSVPVFFATTKIGCDALLGLREQLRRVPELEISITDLVVKACAIALRRCPAMNATFHGDFLRFHEDVDIAVAVAVEGGLVTPVLRSADRKRLVELSAELRGLAERSRAGRLARHEYEGGTITVSNLGMYGLEEFTGIISPPQSAILAVGAIDREVVMGTGVAMERRVLKATLSVDHRVLDGADAARFLAELRSVLENPACVLL